METDKAFRSIADEHCPPFSPSVEVLSAIDGQPQPSSPLGQPNMNPTSSAPSKTPSAPTTANHSPAPSQLSSVAFDTNRRQNQGPSSHAQAAPRRNQVARKQHRNQRRAGPGPGEFHVDEEDTMAELRIARNPSSRRGQTSITHLMSYALPPRPHEGHAPYSRSYRRNPVWGVGSGYHAVDKARYIHANYRFVVTPEGSYASQAADADQHLNWEDVLQVIASTESQQTSCPICLSEPVAPRMAKCGHIFCLPCLMRFMNTSSSEESGKKQPRWRKCPICEDGIFLSDVKPVRFYAGQESPLPRPGDDVILRLMARSAKSTLALPRESGAEVLESGDDIPWHFAANVLDYARIMRGTGGYMGEQFDREVEELLKQEKEDELLYHEDTEWTQKAIRAVHSAKEKMVNLGDTASQTLFSHTLEQGRARLSEHDFYFYTSPPHLYLSPLDIRILKTKYGSFSQFPSTLLPRVEHISTGHVVDDTLRRRAKYLAHLPYGCLISFLECDWTDIVPAEVLAGFSEEIERRRKRNRDKAAQEERERLQAERIEAAQVRGARRQLGVLDEDITAVRFGNTGLDEPRVNFDDFIPLGALSHEGTSPPDLRTGFGSLSDISTSPSGSRTVWGTPAVSGLSAEPTILHRPQLDDGWLKDDAVLETLGAADLAVQLEALSVADAPGPSNLRTANVSVGGGGGGGGGKKKKKQKITLMSTGGRRGN